VWKPASCGPASDTRSVRGLSSSTRRTLASRGVTGCHIRRGAAMARTLRRATDFGCCDVATLALNSWVILGFSLSRIVPYILN
jgi:hypothetical protein